MKLRLCAQSDVPLGTVKRIDVAGSAPLMVAHTLRGFFVIDDTCTHALASLSEGILEDGTTIFCPLHGGAFDVTTGEAIGFPCVDPVKAYSVDVEGDDVSIDWS